MGGTCSLFRSSGIPDQEEAVATWKANYSSSVRSSLLQKKNYAIEEDFRMLKDKLMGKGGCAEVYAAERIDSDQIFAIKICHKNKMDQTRLEREILLLKDTDHCNIVRLFSVYDTLATTYLVMEMCTGGHLGKFLSNRGKTNKMKQNCLDEEWAKSLCRQLLSAVNHMHERGIAHRDIKLQNILLDKSGDSNQTRLAQIKVVDFGYGSRFIGCCPMHTVCGTPYTTAPEVFRESYDERCDIWSVGVVLFIMLCGRRPFETLDVTGPLTEAGKATMITNILAGRYSFNPRYWGHVTLEAQQFIKMLLLPKYLNRVSAKEAMDTHWVHTRTDLVPERVHASVEALNNGCLANSAEPTSPRSVSMKARATDWIAPILPRMMTEPGLVNRVKDDDAKYSLHKVTPVNGDVQVQEEMLMAALENEDMSKSMALSLEHGHATKENSKVSSAISNILVNHSERLSTCSMRRAGNVACAYGLHDTQTADMRNLFQSVDIDGSGALSKKEFSEAMIILCGDALSYADCSLIFDKMDVNRDDQITFTEFLAATINPEALDIEELSRAFALLDHDGDGYLSADELKKMYDFKFVKNRYPQSKPSRQEDPGLTKLGNSMSRVNSNGEDGKLTTLHALTDPLANAQYFVDSMPICEGSLEEKIANMLDSCDIDHDGRVSYEEFIFAMTGASEVLGIHPRSSTKTPPLSVSRKPSISAIDGNDKDQDKDKGKSQGNYAAHDREFVLADREKVKAAHGDDNSSVSNGNSSISSQIQRRVKDAVLSLSRSNSGRTVTPFKELSIVPKKACGITDEDDVSPAALFQNRDESFEAKCAEA